MQFAPIHPLSSEEDEQEQFSTIDHDFEKSGEMEYTFFEGADMEFTPSDFEEDTQGKMSICDLV